MHIFVRFIAIEKPCTHTLISFDLSFSPLHLHFAIALKITPTVDLFTLILTPHTLLRSLVFTVALTLAIALKIIIILAFVDLFALIFTPHTHSRIYSYTCAYSYSQNIDIGPYHSWSVHARRLNAAGLDAASASKQ